MSNKIAWIAILVVMFAGLGYLMTINEEQVTTNVMKDVETLTKKFPTGDEITFYPQPVVQPQDIPIEENNTVPLQQEQPPDVPDEPTPVAEEVPQDPTSEVFVSSSDLSYTRNMSAVQSGTNDQIQLGNIVNIIGSIKLLDIRGGEIPPPHRYTMDIDCEFRDFCNMITMSFRGETDTSGHFQYKWTTNQQDSLGEYVAVITARSDIDDPFGKPYLLKHEYRFWLIE